MSKILFLLAFLITNAFADSIRPIEEVQKELVQLEIEGLTMAELMGLSQIPAHLIVSEPQIIYGLLHQFRDALKSSELDFRFRNDPNAKMLTDPAVRARMFRLLVDLHRHALRSGDSHVAFDSLI